MAYRVYACSAPSVVEGGCSRQPALAPSSLPKKNGNVAGKFDGRFDALRSALLAGAAPQIPELGLIQHRADACPHCARQAVADQHLGPRDRWRIIRQLVVENPCGLSDLLSRAMPPG